MFGDIHEPRDVDFFDNVFPMKTCTLCMFSGTPTLPTGTPTSNENIEPRCSKRPRMESSFGLHFMIIFLAENSDINFSLT